MGCTSSTPPSYHAVGQQLQKTICGDLIKGTDQRGKKVVLMKRFSSLATIVYESPQEEIKTMEIIQQHPHPNLIGLRTAQPIKAPGFRYVAVMDYSSLGDLHKHIIKLASNCRVVGTHITRVFGKQMLQGIKHLHSLGRYHGDISCENLLLFHQKGKLLVKLTDYGFSRVLEPLAPPRSKVGQVYGKPAYLAPELLTADKPYDPAKIDVFAIGVCIYAMMSGHFPFDSTNHDNPQWNNFILNGIQEHSRMMNIDLSDSLSNLLGRMLNPDPEKRSTINEALKHKWFTNK